MFEVQMGWHDAAAAALRKVGGGTWDARKRVWMFPFSSHDKVLDALRNCSGVRVKVDPLHQLPAAVLKSSANIPDDSSRYSHIPKSLEEQLMQFQREGVQFGLRHGGRALIGDEMGLGKTVQAIALAAAYRDEWPGLIIAPSSLREQWADALHKWLGVTEDRVHIVNTGKDAAKVPIGLDFLIVSYNFLDKMVSRILGSRAGVSFKANFVFSNSLLLSISVYYCIYLDPALPSIPDDVLHRFCVLILCFPLFYRIWLGGTMWSS